jgi:hypothetical protein
MFIGFSEKYAKPEGVSIEAAYFPGSYYGPDHDDDGHTYLTGLKNGDITIISKEKAGQMLLDYQIKNNRFEGGGSLDSHEPIAIAFIDDSRRPGGSDKSIKNDYDLEVVNRTKWDFNIIGSRQNIKGFLRDYSIILDDDIKMITKEDANAMIAEYKNRNKKLEGGGGVGRPSKPTILIKLYDKLKEADNLESLIWEYNDDEGWSIVYESGLESLSDYHQGELESYAFYANDKGLIDSVYLLNGHDATNITIERALSGSRAFDNSNSGDVEEFSRGGKMSGWKHKMKTGGGVDDKGVIYDTKTMKIEKIFDGPVKEYKEFKVTAGDKVFYCDVYVNGSAPENLMEKLERIFRKKYPEAYEDYARGGMTEHGLKRGDTIVYNSGNEVMVVDKNKNQKLVDLDKGERLMKGGSTSGWKHKMKTGGGVGENNMHVKAYQLTGAYGSKGIAGKVLFEFKKEVEKLNLPLDLNKALNEINTLWNKWSISEGAKIIENEVVKVVKNTSDIEFITATLNQFKWEADAVNNLNNQGIKNKLWIRIPGDFVINVGFNNVDASNFSKKLGGMKNDPININQTDVLGKYKNVGRNNVEIRESLFLLLEVVKGKKKFDGGGGIDEHKLKYSLNNVYMSTIELKGVDFKRASVVIYNSKNLSLTSDLLNKIKDLIQSYSGSSIVKVLKDQNKDYYFTIDNKMIAKKTKEFTIELEKLMNANNFYLADVNLLKQFTTGVFWSGELNEDYFDLWAFLMNLKNFAKEAETKDRFHYEKVMQEERNYIDTTRKRWSKESREAEQGKDLKKYKSINQKLWKADLYETGGGIDDEYSDDEEYSDDDILYKYNEAIYNIEDWMPDNIQLMDEYSYLLESGDVDGLTTFIEEYADEDTLAERYGITYTEYENLAVTAINM